MKNSHVFYIAGALLCIAPHMSRAEGEVPRTDGVFGVNRRVVTTPDTSQPYNCGVDGVFSIPTIFVPSNVAAANGANSKPTFYLGARIDQGPSVGGFEVDAGVQYESQGVSYTDPNGVVVLVNPGYGIFVRTSNADEQDLNLGNPFRNDPGNNSYVVPQGRYRFGPNTLNNGVTVIGLTLLFDPHFNGPAYIGHRAHLQADVIGAAGQPGGFGSPGRVDAHHGVRVRTRGAGGLANVSMKRVVGITQGGTVRNAAGVVTIDYRQNLNFPLFGADQYYEEDGSYMRQCIFVEGRIASNAVAPSWQSWDTVDIDQLRTGSIPGPNVSDQTYTNIPGPVIRHAPSALPIFQYPDIADPSSTDSSRYKAETMNINLRRAVAVTGNVVTPVFQTPGVSG